MGQNMIILSLPVYLNLNFLKTKKCSDSVHWHQNFLLGLVIMYVLRFFLCSRILQTSKVLGIKILDVYNYLFLC
ncbi:hypothetical protein L873DRAFT_1026260 [Choiromyces venosus 120613-1]|uniref:Uncharacterized protein n=1 Tax=Choiromyces venosus 120613-1 TaxID=1336337 RepID=A0A3N4JJL4_9PEZI|nr:hypothetical protein L873DRAFT_1026260 [Choiromyces venosus 120613-1]